VKLKQIQLTGFRNYASQVVSFGDGINLLYGENAQGKTNVVEAIHLLATGKSHRTRHLTDMIQQGREGFCIEAVLAYPEYEKTLTLTYDRRNGRGIRVNDVPRAKWSELLGQLHVLLFSPETMDVVKGGPSERRRFLDILLCQIDSRYLRSLQQYTAILRQKSSALRDRNGFGQYRDMLPVWNDALAHHAGYIANMRRQVVASLEAFANEELRVLSGGSETLTLQLQTFLSRNDSMETLLQQDIPAEEAFAGYLGKKLQRMAAREEQAGACLTGIHRDEVHFILNDQTARVFASQGQQRSIALSLILAATRLYQQQSGEMPLLLLDDVMSELDPMRQSHLLRVLEKTQTLITTTDRHAYEHRLPDDTKWFHVRSGCVMEDA
jgi:DNA replication and repair protein RecF